MSQTSRDSDADDLVEALTDLEFMRPRLADAQALVYRWSTRVFAIENDIQTPRRLSAQADVHINELRGLIAVARGTGLMRFMYSERWVAEFESSVGEIKTVKNEIESGIIDLLCWKSAAESEVCPATQDMSFTCSRFG